MTEIIQIITALISGAAIVFVAYINMKANRQKQVSDAAQAARDERDERREELLLHLLKATRANGELTHATALAVKRGHTNGEMDKALKEYEEVSKDREEVWERRQASSFNATQTVTIGEDKAVSGKTIRSCIAICVVTFLLMMITFVAYNNWYAEKNYQETLEVAREQIEYEWRNK